MPKGEHVEHDLEKRIVGIGLKERFDRINAGVAKVDASFEITQDKYMFNEPIEGEGFGEDFYAKYHQALYAEVSNLDGLEDDSVGLEQELNSQIEELAKKNYGEKFVDSLMQQIGIFKYDNPRFTGKMHGYDLNDVENKEWQRFVGFSKNKALVLSLKDDARNFCQMMAERMKKKYREDCKNKAVEVLGNIEKTNKKIKDIRGKYGRDIGIDVDFKKQLADIKEDLSGLRDSFSAQKKGWKKFFKALYNFVGIKTQRDKFVRTIDNVIADLDDASMSNSLEINKVIVEKFKGLHEQVKQQAEAVRPKSSSSSAPS